MAAFCEQTVNNYRSDNSIPNELTNQTILSHSKTFEDLTKYCKEIISFLQTNYIYESPYSLQAPDFHYLFKRFAQYYNNSSLSLTNKLELVKFEQIIHMITEISATQDITSYLNLLEEILSQNEDNEEKICELIFLVSNKHRVWHDEHSKTYAKWMHFIAPFLQFIKKINFDYDKLLLENIGASENAQLYKETIENTIKELNKLIEKRDLEIIKQDGDILSQVGKARKSLLTGNFSRDNQYYYEIGLCSFLANLLRSLSMKDLTLIKISLLVAPYQNKIKEFAGKIEIPSLEENEAPLLDLKFLENLLFKVNQPHIEELEKNSLIQVILHTIHLLSFESINKTMQMRQLNHSTWLNEFFAFLHNNEKALESGQNSYYGDFINNYEFLIFYISRVIKQIWENFEYGSSNSTEFGSIFCEKWRLINQKKNLKPFIRCSGVYLLLLEISKRGFFTERIRTEFNLSDINLKNLIRVEYSDDYENLFLDLNYTVRYFRFDKGEKNFDALIEMFSECIDEINKGNKVMKDRYKIIAIFLLKLITLNTETLKEINLEFIFSLFKFLTQKCKLNKWDAIYIKENTRFLLNHAANSKRIILDKSLQDLCVVYEQLLADTGLKTSILDSSYILKDAKIYKRLDKIFVDSLYNSSAIITNTYKILNWDQLENPEETKKIQAIQDEYKKLIYMTLSWVETLYTKRSKKSKKEFVQDPKNLMLDKITLLYCHPAFLLTRDTREHKIFTNIFASMMNFNDKLGWRAFQLLLKALKDGINDLNKKMSFITEGQNIDLGFDYLKPYEAYFNLLEQQSEKPQKIDPNHLLYHSVITTIINIQNTLKTELDPAQVNEKEIFLKTLKSLVDVLPDFVLDNTILLQKAEETNLKIINALISGVQTISKIPSQFEESYAHIQDLFRCLLNKGLNNKDPKQVIYLMEIVLNIITKLPEKLRVHVSYIICWQGNVWKHLLEKFSERVKIEKESKEGGFSQSKTYQQIEPLINIIKLSFTKDEKLPHIKKLFFKKLDKAPDKYVIDMFWTMNELLESFPFVEIIQFYNDTLNQIFTLPLKMFEKCYVYTKLDTKEEIVTIDQAFQTKANLFVSLYPFEGLKTLNEGQYNLFIKKTLTALINSLTKLNIEVLKKSCVSVPIELAQELNEEIKAEEIIKIKATRNELANTILTQQYYFHLLMNLLLECKEQIPLEDSFIWLQYYSSSNLIQSLLKLSKEESLELREEITKKQLSEKFQIFVHNVNQMLFLYFTSKNSQGKLSSSDTSAIFQWIDLLVQLQSFTENALDFDITSSKYLSIPNLFDLIQIAFSFDPVLAYEILFEEKGLMKSLLTMKSFKTQNISKINSMIFLFNFLLDNSLPEALEIEYQIKEILKHLPKSALDLESLRKDAYFSEKERKNPDALLSVLNTRFRTTQDKYRYTRLISIDISEGKQTAEDQITQILEKLPIPAQRIFETLAFSLVENYLKNLEQITNSKDSSNSTNYRDTSAILTILKVILENQRHLAVYFIFKSFNFQQLISSFSSKIPFLQDESPEKFTSISLWECLVKLKYFGFHGQDLLMIGSTFISPTKITLVNPFDSQTTMIDINFILIKEVINSLIKELEENYSRNQKDILAAMGGYVFVDNVICLFNAIAKKKGVIVQSEEEIKKHLLKLFQPIALNLSANLEFGPKDPQHFKHICKLLTKHFEQIKGILFPQNKFKDEDVREVKSEKYKEFLDEKAFESTLDYQEKILVNLQASKNENLEAQAKEEKDLKAQIIALLKDFGSIAELSINICGKTDIIPEEKIDIKGEKKTIPAVSFSQHVAEIIHAIHLTRSSNSRFFQKIVEEKGEANTLQRFEECIRSNLIDLEQEISIKPIAPALLEIKCVPLFEVKVPLVSNQKEKIEEKQEVKNIDISKQLNIYTPPCTPPADNKKSTITEENKEEEKKEGQNEENEKRKIKYFIIPNINTKAEFDSIVKQVSSILKIMNEEVLVSVQSSNLSNKEAEKHKQTYIENKIAGLTMSELEKNIFYCRAEIFSFLNPFPYPENFAEIKEEFQWINDDFDEYLTTLKEMGLKDETLEAPININNEKSQHQETLFFNGFEFCKTSPNSLVVMTPEKTTILESVKLFKELYPFGEKTIEALVAFFYVRTEGKFIDNNQDFISLLKELSFAPNFEIKLLDFCLFFLYSPDHLEIIKQKQMKFPYSRVFNEEESTQTALETYRITALNILYFLKSMMNSNGYLIYQPSALLEQYGMKSLQEIKGLVSFKEKRKDLISICDMFVGLLDVNEIACNTELSQIVEAIILDIFSEEKKFKVFGAKETNEYIEEKNLITLKSCQRLLHVKNIQSRFKQLANLLIFDFKKVIKEIEDKIDVLYKPLEKMSSLLKVVLRNGNDKAKSSALQLLPKINSHIVELRDCLFMPASLLANWDIEQNSSAYFPRVENEELYIAGLKIINKHILQEKIVQDFIILLFDQVQTMFTSRIANITEFTDTTQNLAKICLYFYILYCVNRFRGKSHEETNNQDMNNTDLPPLSRMVSKDSEFGGNDDIPELKLTYSKMKKSSKFDLDILFANMCRKCEGILQQVIYLPSTKNSSDKLIPEFGIVCRRLPWLLDLSKKKDMLNEALQNDREANRGGTRNIIIKRDDVLGSTLKEFSSKTLKELKDYVRVEFDGEPGYDGGGLRREYYSIIVREIFNPKNGLFQTAENGVNLQPSPEARVMIHHLKYMELAGIILAKAIQQDCVVDVDLTKPFLKHILKREITVNDLEEIDSSLSKSLKWMLENSVEGLEQSFTYETKILGQYITRELVPNGDDIIVDDQNKKDFVKRVCKMKLRDEIGEELAAFTRGFNLIIPSEFFSFFSPSEVQILIAGVPTIDFNELKATSTYSDYKASDNIITWLWEIVSEFSQKELASFVFFISGSIKISHGLLKDEPFHFRKYYTSLEGTLPIAHTCYREMEIPEYKTKEELRQKLLLAIFEGQEGYGFG